MINNLKEIYDEYARLIMYVSYMQIGNKQEAEEITQETFIRFMDSSLGHAPKEDIRRWLIRVAVNLCLDQKRKFLVRLRHYWNTQKNNNLFELNSSEIKNELEQILSKVDGRTKMAIILKYGQEIEYKEISEIMDLPESTVKTIVFRGLNKIRGKR